MLIDQKSTDPSITTGNLQKCTANSGAEPLLPNASEIKAATLWGPKQSREVADAVGAAG